MTPQMEVLGRDRDAAWIRIYIFIVFKLLILVFVYVCDKTHLLTSFMIYVCLSINIWFEI